MKKENWIYQSLILESLPNALEALVFTFLLVSTLGIIFFTIFFQEPPKVPTKKMK